MINTEERTLTASPCLAVVKLTNPILLAVASLKTEGWESRQIHRLQLSYLLLERI